MTIKKAVLITLLSASVVGLLALGFKTNSFSKENIKNSFKLQDNESNKHRKAPIKVNAENQTYTHTYNSQIIEQTQQNNTIDEEYKIYINNIQTQSFRTEYATISYVTYITYRYTNDSFSTDAGRSFELLTVLKIENYKNSTFDITFTLPSITLFHTHENQRTVFIRTEIYQTDSFPNEEYINIYGNDPFNIPLNTHPGGYNTYYLDNSNNTLLGDESQYAYQGTENNPSTYKQTITNYEIELENYQQQKNTTKYIIVKTTEQNYYWNPNNNQWISNPSNISTINIQPPQFTITDTYPAPILTTEVIDIPGLMLDILTMPFTFITTAFNVTLWEGTPYQFNFSNFVLSLIAVATLLFIIKLFTNGMGAIGNFTSRGTQNSLNRSQTKLNKAKTKKIKSNNKKE